MKIIKYFQKLLTTKINYAILDVTYEQWHKVNQLCKSKVSHPLNHFS